MKIIGMVGGIGPESTIEYYRIIIAAYRARVRDASYPRIIINSINLERLVAMITDGRLGEAMGSPPGQFQGCVSG